MTGQTYSGQTHSGQTHSGRTYPRQTYPGQTGNGQAYPMRVEGRLEPGLSRWLWLVKWLLAVPHYLLLVFLWVAMGVLSGCALVAIVVTGRYPRGIFDFNVGVLRWSWRVAYYGYGALGTDRYPPFSLGEVPDYPAQLHVAYPERLSRGLVLVKWWLLVLPHYLVVTALVGGSLVAVTTSPVTVGLVGILVLVAAVVLLFTGRYPTGVFDLVLGLDRWVLRVAAYVTLMTDDYPPFRLDLGGVDPGGPPASAAPGTDRPGELSDRTAGPRRLAAVVAGALVFLLGGALFAGGAALGVADRVLRDADGDLLTPAVTVASLGSAVVLEGVEVSEPGAEVLDQVFGRTRVRVEAGTGKELFVGVARSSDASAYLSGVARSRLVDLGSKPAGVTYRQLQGGTAPGAPGSTSLWSASAQGPGRQTATWQPQQGDWTVVLMNADGSPGVTARAAVGVTFPDADRVVVALLVPGGLLLVTAVGILLLAVRRPVR